MNEIPKKRARSNPNPSSSKEIEREEQVMNKRREECKELPEDMISLP
jgi:hypothetical protein